MSWKLGELEQYLGTLHNETLYEEADGDEDLCLHSIALMQNLTKYFLRFAIIDILEFLFCVKII